MGECTTEVAVCQYNSVLCVSVCLWKRLVLYLLDKCWFVRHVYKMWAGLCVWGLYLFWCVSQSCICVSVELCKYSMWVGWLKWTLPHSLTLPLCSAGWGHVGMLCPSVYESECVCPNLCVVRVDVWMALKPDFGLCPEYHNPSCLCVPVCGYYSNCMYVCMYVGETEGVWRGRDTLVYVWERQRGCVCLG